MKYRIAILELIYHNGTGFGEFETWHHHSQINYILCTSVTHL